MVGGASRRSTAGQAAKVGRTTSGAGGLKPLPVEMFQTAEAKLTRAEAGSTASVTGLWMSIPLSADPVVGVVLLSGVGTWPPPDGV